MEIHQKISMPKYQIRNLDYEILAPEMRELRQVQWLRVAGDQVVLKEDKGNANNGKQKGQCSRGDQCSFRHDNHERAKSDTEHRSVF